MQIAFTGILAFTVSIYHGKNLMIFNPEINAWNMRKLYIIYVQY